MMMMTSYKDTDAAKDQASTASLTYSPLHLGPITGSNNNNPVPSSWLPPPPPPPAEPIIEGDRTNGGPRPDTAKCSLWVDCSWVRAFSIASSTAVTRDQSCAVIGVMRVVVDVGLMMLLPLLLPNRSMNIVLSSKCFVDMYFEGS